METLRRQAVQALYQTLAREIDSLIETIRAPCTGVVVYRLPIIDADARVPTHIHVGTLGKLERVDTEALTLATEALRQFTRQPGQKPSTTYRLPGALVVDRDLSTQIRNINGLNDDLKQQLKAGYPNTIARSRECNQLLPGVHMNHVYRNLYTVPPDCTRVNLTWQCQSQADVWISPDEAIRMATAALEEEAQHSAARQNSDRQTALRIALKQFQSLSTPAEFTVQ
ncbi:MAG: hypothetical protein HKN43_16035 [Rhodothermales bacterium]|nr:hypothetical protein [Rhodothermales bacterium]